MQSDTFVVGKHTAERQSVSPCFPGPSNKSHQAVGGCDAQVLVLSAASKMMWIAQSLTSAERSVYITKCLAVVLGKRTYDMS